MIHHVSVGTHDVVRARRFYDPIMALLGLRMISADEKSANYGTGSILFSLETPVDGRPASLGNGTHVGFKAKDRAMVRAFHAAGLAHGGTEDGAPGRRAESDTTTTAPSCATRTATKSRW